MIVYLGMVLLFYAQGLKWKLPSEVCCIVIQQSFINHTSVHLYDGTVYAFPHSLPTSADTPGNLRDLTFDIRTLFHIFIHTSDSVRSVLLSV